MLLYLYAICKNGSSFVESVTDGKEVTDILPSGVIYLSSNISATNRSNYESIEISEADAEKKLSRSGILLGERDILEAMNNSMNSKYLLGTKISASDELKGSSLVSSEKFEEIFKELEGVIIKISDQLENGVISAHPLKTQNSPCEYCTSKPICRNIQK